jgi:hypothetical protein
MFPCFVFITTERIWYWGPCSVLLGEFHFGSYRPRVNTGTGNPYSKQNSFFFLKTAILRKNKIIHCHKMWIWTRSAFVLIFVIAFNTVCGFVRLTCSVLSFASLGCVYDRWTSRLVRCAGSNRALRKDLFSKWSTYTSVVQYTSLGVCWFVLSLHKLIIMRVFRSCWRALINLIRFLGILCMSRRIAVLREWKILFRGLRKKKW